MTRSIKKRVRNRSPQWTMAGVHQACPSAIAVYAALTDLAQAYQRRHLTPTRAQLCSLCGVRDPDTVSKALGVLHEAGWIIKETIPVTDNGVISAKVYEISLTRTLPNRDVLEYARASARNTGIKRALPRPDSSRDRRPIVKGITMPLADGHEFSLKGKGRDDRPKRQGRVASLEPLEIDEKIIAPSPPLPPEPHLPSDVANRLLTFGHPDSRGDNGASILLDLTRHAETGDGDAYDGAVVKLVTNLEVNDDQVLRMAIEALGLDVSRHDELMGIAKSVDIPTEIRPDSG